MALKENSDQRVEVTGEQVLGEYQKEGSYSQKARDGWGYLKRQ